MTTDAVGGVWRCGLDLAQALCARGIDTVLACIGPAPSTEQENEAAEQGLRLLVPGLPLDWLAAGEADLADVPRRLADLADAQGCDLLHLNLPSQAAGLETSRPVVVMSHSCVVTWWRAMRREPLPREWDWQKRLNRQGLERADLVLAPSRAHADALAEAYGPVGSLRVVPNAVRALVDPSPRGAREPVAFAAGRWWDEGKNAAVLDAAARDLDGPLFVAGACDGRNGQSFRFAHARWLGPQPHRAVRARMRSASIFVSPSRYEPFGLAALEAAEAGAALVLADIPTYRDIWRDAALFADPADPTAFRLAIERLAHDGGMREEIASAARARAGAFTPAAQADATLAAYRAAGSTAASRHRSHA